MKFTDTLQKYSAIDTKKGTDKITSHSYGDYYNEVFEKYLNKNCKLLEIGIDGGYGLLAYKEYLNNAEIYGIDIKDNRDSYVIEKSNQYNLYIGDATNANTINAFPYMFDIIIEDASHLPEHQIQHFKDFSKYVNKNGIYIIEDVHENNYIYVYNSLKQYAELNGFTIEIIDLRHIKNRFDDILIVLKRN